MLKSSYISQNLSQFLVLRTLRSAQVFIFIALIIWVTHFWHFQSFGLYEDDFTRIPNAMEMTGSEVSNYILKLILRFGGQGRPLHPGLIYGFSFLGSKLGGLQTVYLIGYAIITVNAFLFYVLLRRIFPHKVFALMGVLAFALFPVDTTKIFLTHSLGVQPSLTFLLLALHCYLSNKKKLAYLILFGSLITYERLFPIFWVAPLLRNKWNSLKLLQEMFKHTLILAVMIFCIFMLRKVKGESRVDDLEFTSSIFQIIRDMSIGPLISLRTFIYRPLQTLLKLKGELLLFVSLSLAALVWIFSQLKLKLSSKELTLKTFIDNRVLHLKSIQLFHPLVKLAVIGFVMLILAYPFTFHGSIYDISGRASRVHVAAAIGVSIICACLCSGIMMIAKIYGQKNLAAGILAAFFSLLVGFGLIVQHDYKLAWQYQRAFWTDLIQLCPDLKKGTVILVESTGLRDIEQINANTWPLPRILGQIYQFPDDWKHPTKHPFFYPDRQPRVYRLQKRWRSRIVSDRNLFQLDESTIIGPPTLYDVVDSANVILIETKNGKLTRRTEPLIIDGQEFPLKPQSASELPPFEKGHLYDYLIRSPEEDPVDYIR